MWSSRAEEGNQGLSGVSLEREVFGKRAACSVQRTTHLGMEVFKKRQQGTLQVNHSSVKGNGHVKWAVEG